MKFVVILLVMAISVLSFNAYGQEPVEMEHEPILMEQVNSKVPIKVQLFWPEVLPDKLYDIQLYFLDPDTDELLEGKKITFDLIVNTKDMRIETYPMQNVTSGSTHFALLFPEKITGPAEVTIRINSIDDGFEIKEFDPEIMTFTVQVVPEFVTLTLIVMALSFIAVLTVQRLKIFVNFH